MGGSEREIPIVRPDCYLLIATKQITDLPIRSQQLYHGSVVRATIRNITRDHDNLGGSPRVNESLD